MIFNYEGVDNKIQCTKEEKFKDICKKFRFKINEEQKEFYYMYNGTLIQNEELTFDEIANSEDKIRNKMNILVNKLEPENNIQDNSDNYMIKSKNIICPQCKEDINSF